MNNLQRYITRATMLVVLMASVFIAKSQIFGPPVAFSGQSTTYIVLAGGTHCDDPMDWILNPASMGTVVANGNLVTIHWSCPPSPATSIAVSLTATRLKCERSWAKDDPAVFAIIGITITTLLPVADAIIGVDTVCEGSIVTYSTTAVPNASSYTWTVVNGGGTVLPGQNGTTAQILWNNGLANSADETVRVTPFSGPGCAGTASSFSVNVQKITQLALTPFSGLICGGTSRNYTVNLVNGPDPNIEAYHWELPVGAHIDPSTLADGNSILVNFDPYAQSGDIIVNSIYACGNGDTTSTPVDVTVLPFPPGAIQGLVSVCQGDTATYSIPPVSNLDPNSNPADDYYVWTITGGTPVSITTSSPNLFVTWNAVGIGTVKVQPHNQCGLSPDFSTLNVIVHPHQTIPVQDSVNFNDAALSSSSFQNLVFDHCGTSTSCGNKLIDKATLFLTYNTGEDYNYGSNGFTTNVQVQITGYGGLNNTGPSVVSKLVNLNINQNEPEQVFQLDFTTDYYQIHSFKIEILSYVGNAMVANDIQLVAQYKEVFKYDASTLVTMITLNTAAPISGSNQYKFNWNNNACSDFPNYEIQILRLFNNDPNVATNSNIHKVDEIDWNEALAIETQSSQTDITLTLAEGTGFYVWRVRPIGNYFDGGIGNDKNWGLWSNHTNYEQGDLNVSSTSFPAFTYLQFNEDINWIYSRTFTEGNIYKDEQVRISENITFANGLQQARQTQAHLSSNNKILTTQTVLDFSGRPALSSMPVPLNNQISLGFQPAFMKNTSGFAGNIYTALDFDKDNNFKNPGAVNDGSGEHFEYYSNSNADLTIPNAEQYPFTRTLFYNDGNSRVKEQSGVGETFRIKASLISSKTNQTFYSGVADEELIRVFGDEAPFNESTHKVINIDGNKTATVTYIGKDGKTLATCLATNGINELNGNDALMGLASQDVAGFTVKDIIDNTTPFGDFGNQATTSRTFVDEIPVLVNIHYDLTPKSIQEICLNYCKTCDYFIEISVQNIEQPDSAYFFHSILLPAGICDSTNLAPYVLDSSVVLPKGTYIFTKRVVANNTDPNTINPLDSLGSTYLELCLDSVENQYDSLIYGPGGDLEIINGYLDSADINGLYTHLGLDLDNLPPNIEDSVIYIPIGCDSVAIPIILCTPKLCPPDQSFAQYFDDFWVDSSNQQIYSFSTISNINGGVHYTNTEFDQLVENMINEGYSCDSLWDCWYAIVQSYEELNDSIYANANLPAALLNSFNIVDAFLDCAGRRIDGINGTTSAPGNNAFAYKYFNYDGNNPLCEAFFVEQYGLTYPDPSCAYKPANLTSSFACFVDSTWNLFYLCVTNTDPNPSNPVADTNAVTAAQTITDTCRVYCEIKRAGFIDAIITAFHQNQEYVGANPDTDSNGVYPFSGDFYALEFDSVLNSFQFNDTDTLDQSSTTFIPWSEIACMADALVQNCKEGCTITPVYNVVIDPITGDSLQGDTLLSMGTPEELIAYGNAFTGAYEVSVTCVPKDSIPWDTITSNGALGVNGIIPVPHVFMNYTNTRVYDHLFVVTNTNDAGPGSLLQAIQNAPFVSSAKITFEIPGPAPHVINVTGSYLHLTGSRIFINGSSQPANGYTGIEPKIIIDGSLSQTTKVGFLVHADSVVIEGLHIRKFRQGITTTNFSSDGIIIVNNMINEIINKCISLQGASNGIVLSNLIGTNLNFSAPLVNTSRGIGLGQWTSVTLGSTNAEINTIANLGSGITMTDAFQAINIGKISRTRIFDVGFAINSDESPPTINIATLGFLSGTAPANTIVEVFRSVAPQQMNEYFTTVTATAGGTWSVSNSSISPNDGFIATATDSVTGTSPVSNFIIVEPCDFNDFCFRYVRWFVIPDSIPEILPLSCEEVAANDIANSIEQVVYEYIQNKVDSFEADYMNVCTNPDSINDNFWLTYPLGYHHYTLYYYNRAGSLIQTVPPQGVDLLDRDNAQDPIDSFFVTTPSMDRTKSPVHRFITDYEYNSLGQLIKQNTPDGNTSEFYYNNLGQLRFSQNAEQARVNVGQGKVATYSYTKYDKLGRIIEVGESTQAAPNNDFIISVDSANFPSVPVGNPSLNSQVTYTAYTQDANVSYLNDMQTYQRFLLNRISYTYTDEDGDLSGTTNDQTYTYYSYDPHGNVEWLIQDIPGFVDKQYVRYEYDLVSGNVLKVCYNENKLDQFYHRYAYDSDNRITRAETSINNITWEKDAGYEYYIHGPLKRTKIGEDNVQGLDYVYTIHGWLKALNHASLDKTLDPGNDGINGNSNFAKDVFAMQLGYFTGDFNRNNNNPFNTNIVNNINNATLNPESNRDLYNGNISTWASNNMAHPNSIDPATNISLDPYPGLTAYQYRYDELNRIRIADFKENITGGSFNPTLDYNSSYNYDANGNLYRLDRNSKSSERLMDGLSYHYYDAAGGIYDQNSQVPVLPTNKLAYVDDDYNTVEASDIEPQAAGNYDYDEIGNLIKDDSEEIQEIKWTVYGKVKEIIRTPTSTKPNLKFIYDASGNRIAKIVIPDVTDPVQTTTTWYSRDASGNVMAIYESVYATNPTGLTEEIYLIEQPIYGSSRVGERKERILIKTVNHPTAGNPTEIPGNLNPLITESTNMLIGVQKPFSFVFFPSPFGFSLALMLPQTGAKQDVNFSTTSPTVSTPNAQFGFGVQGKNLCVVEDNNGNVVFSAYTAKQLGFGNNGGNVCRVLDANNNMIPILSLANPIKSNWQGKMLGMKKPGSTNIYYLFTVGTDKIAYYHEIDIALGQVINVNIPIDPLTTNFGWGMALVDDASNDNGKLYLRKYNSNGTANVLTYDITSLGITSGLAIPINFPSKDANGKGEIQISPDGTKLAIANTFKIGWWWSASEIKVYDLNTTHNITGAPTTIGTGVFSNVQSLDFSPTSENIYYGKQTTVFFGSGSNGKSIVKANLLNPLASTIINGVNGEVRRAKDGNMYVAVANQTNLQQITNPDGAHSVSNFAVATTSWRITGAIPLQPHKILALDNNLFTRTLGKKTYEINDHLGNVRAVVSDLKHSTLIAGVPSDYEPDIVATNNYYAFGMQMPGRSFNAGDYRYGFNGMEKDNEIKGNGNSYTTEFRQYDPRLARWLSIDPEMRKYASWSPYVFSFNNPINFTDEDGADPCGGGDGKGKRRAKRECRNAFKKKRTKKPRLRKVNSKTIIKTVITQADPLVGKKSVENENFSEEFEIPDNGEEFKVEFDAFEIADKFGVFDAETGKRIGGSDDFESGKQEVKIPGGVEKIRIDVVKNKTQNTEFDVKVRSTKLKKVRTVKKRIRGGKNSKKKFELKPKAGDKPGRTRKVRRR